MGLKVKRIVGVSTTFYIYDADGELVAEYGSSTTTDRQYLTQDHLGSTRLITRTGSNIAARRDYYPFGASMTTENGRGALWGAAMPTQQFTGQQRDDESKLDDFSARHYAPTLARFLSPDGVLVDQNPADPRSWNLFSYVRNNPLSLIDPSGRCSQTADGNFIDDDNGATFIHKGACGTAIGDLNSSMSVTVSEDDALSSLPTISGPGVQMSDVPLLSESDKRAAACFADVGLRLALDLARSVNPVIYAVGILSTVADVAGYEINPVQGFFYGDAAGD